MLTLIKVCTLTPNGTPAAFLSFCRKNVRMQTMGRKRTKLTINVTDYAELRRALRRVTEARDKERLRVVLRATSGRYTLEDLAKVSGRSRSTIQLWIDKFNRGGIAGLLKRDTPPGSISPIGAAEIQAELQAGLLLGRWPTAADVAAWLKDKHGILRSRKSVYYWFRRSGEGKSMTTPSSRQKPN